MTASYLNGLDDFKLTLDGNATTSGALVPVNPGTHTADETELPGWTFKGFTGDCDDNGKVTIALGETKTCTLTNDDDKETPTGTTVQSWVLHDSLTIVNIRTGGSPEPAGTKVEVTFSLYDNAACEVGLVGSETVDVPMGSTTVTVYTDDGITVEDPGTYYWQACYSGDSYNTGFCTKCADEWTQIVAVDADHPADVDSLDGEIAY